MKETVRDRSRHQRIRRVYVAVVLAVSVMVMGSCVPLKPELRGPLEPMPETFSLYSPEPEPLDEWWKEFHAAELDALVEQALSGNFTLQEAWARLEQAKAQAVQAGAGLYPDLTANAGASRGRQRTENGSADTRTVKEYSLGVLSSYEIDLWGRIRSEREAARLSVQATRDDLSAAAITLAAEVSSRWVNIIAQGMQKRLLLQQLGTNRTFLELVELRFRKGMVSALDVYQQRQVVEQTKAEIPLVEQEDMLLRHELAVLLGRPPHTSLHIQQQTVPTPEKLPSPGLPVDLLAARPDVRSAGLRLRAADWQVAAARAQRLPSLVLTGTGAFSAGEWGLVFDNWLAQLAGSLVAPLFDGNRRAAEVDRTRAVAEERLWVYRNAVLTALKEVEDALVRETKQREYIQGLELQINVSRRALDQATERYRKGLSDYLPVLTALRTVQGLERALIRQRALLVVERIDLYRALGGSWANDLIPGAIPATDGAPRPVHQ